MPKLLLRLPLFVTFIVISVSLFAQHSKPVFVLTYCGKADNDLYRLLLRERLIDHRYDNPEQAVDKAVAGSGVFIIAPNYPTAGINISQALLTRAKQKRLRLYIEYPASIPSVDIGADPFVATLERGVITGNAWNGRLDPMDLLSINGCHILPAKATDPMIVLAKVAGFNKAEYGVDDVPSYPVLFSKDEMLIATTALSNFSTARFAPRASWQRIWEYVISWLTKKDKLLNSSLPASVTPMYAENTLLPANAKRLSIKKGAEWFYKGRFLIHPVWRDTVDKYMGDGVRPFGPAVSTALPSGDGSLGILEGHASKIDENGNQQYRYSVRADVQGETAFALASAGHLLGNKKYYNVASELASYIFKNSNLRSGAKANPDSASFGLIGWATSHPGLFYEDDNARSMLGLIGASSYTKERKWDRQIAENIMANFRTTGKEGFRGDRLLEKQIRDSGWRYYQNRSLFFPHPHYESWMWACYLWLYQQTKYAPLLEKTKNAIRLTMAAYPDKWLWSNGIQQERARMILPLAWLVRIEPTEEHRHWLDQVVNKLLESQQPCGAIREELGNSSTGLYGASSSNEAYGTDEAPLIFRNGDPVADMLYTSNFAFFALNEAATATRDNRYQQAVNKLSDFLVRIQVSSQKHPDVDGAWFRAFDFKRWDYWASNADAGWGAWCTLGGWIQSWIVATQTYVVQHTSFWDATVSTGKGIGVIMPEVINEMK